MKMSEEMAVRLHRMMWSDMQRELGDTPDASDRNRFKEKWCETHFPGEYIRFNCFLCDYCGHDHCDKCPIEWPDGVCSSVFVQPPAKTDYRFAPISEILALPTRNKKFTDEKAAYYKVGTYYQFREALLSQASGIPASSAIDDHVKAIQEKAVEEYFEKKPAAKLATMDVDNAFKQYADEQKAPIFHALAEASGLSAGNESVKEHISLIRDTAKKNGRAERSSEVFRELAKTSGLSAGKWCISDHVKAIQEKAQEPMQTLRKTSMQLADKLDRYKDALAKESGLNHNIPVDDHIHEIVKNSMEAGAAKERDRIQEKIYEVLLS